MNINLYVSIIIKGIVSLTYLFLMIKILGKKQISQLNIFDYVIGISMGNIAAEMTINKDISIINGLLSMTIYALLSLFVSIITYKSIYARRFLEGYPIILIENGKISKNSLKKVKIDLNDLMQDARENGYFNISEIEYAIMEVSGKVSFLPKAKYSPITNNDLNNKVSYKGLCANLVIDGKIMHNNLKAINHNDEWLIKRLNKLGYFDINKLFLVICDSKEQLTIYEKDYITSSSCLE